MEWLTEELITDARLWLPIEGEFTQPGRGDVLYNIANILVDDRPYEAIEYYCKSLHIDPFNSSCWFNYALACLNVQDTKTAIRCFTIGLSIDPYNDDAFCNYGLALVDNGSHEAAERALFVH